MLQSIKLLVVTGAMTLSAISFPSQARQLSEQDALARAGEFFSTMKGRSAKQAFNPDGARLVYTAQKQGQLLYYVFNQDARGFFIVSADDRMPAILGYSHSGAINMSDLPQNVKYWLGEYQRQAEWIVSNPARYGSVMRENSVSYPNIEPIVSAKWSSRLPFNSLCPLEGKTRTLTGSVAVAMGQIMHHYQWPERGRGSVSYECTSLSEPQTISADLGESVYDWANMLDEYEANYTSEQVTAVATLLYDCAVATKMQFGSEESVTNYDAIGAFTENFAYNPVTIKSHLLSDYITDEIAQLIIAELEANRPVYLTGEAGASASQAMVIDGWNEEGMAHVNWGIGGYNDGYFLLSALTMNSKEYTSDQRIITGIQPIDDTTPSDTPEMWAQGNLEVEVINGVDTFKASDGMMLNNSKEDATFNISVRFTNRKTAEETVAENFLTVTLNKGEGLNEIADNFNATLPDGNYKVQLVYRVAGTQEWSIFRHVPYGSRNYVYATVKDGVISYSNEDNVIDLTISKWNYEKIMNQYAENLIGFTITNNAERAYEDSLRVVLTDSAATEYVIHKFAPMLKPRQSREIKFTFGATKADSALVNGNYDISVLDMEKFLFGETQDIVLDSLFNDEGLKGSKLEYHIISDSLKTCEVVAGEYTSNIVIPEKAIIGKSSYRVVGIARGAFNSADGAKTVYVPKTVTTIDFYQNFTYSVDSIYISDENPVYMAKDGIAFSKDGKSILRYPGGRSTDNYIIPEGVTSIGRGAFYASKPSLVTIPEGITSMGEYAFEYASVKLIYLPASLETIGSYALNYMSNCTEIRISTSNKNFTVLDGSLFTKDMLRFIQYPGGKSSSQYNVPEVVNSIDAKAFAGATKLGGVKLPTTLKSIGDAAFYGCKLLTKIDVPNNVTFIGAEAFSQCSGLVSISLGQSVSYIGAKAFNLTAGASKLEKVTSRNSVPPTLVIGENESFNEYDYEHAILYVKAECAEVYSQAEGWKNFKDIRELSPETHNLQYRITSESTCEVIPGDYVGTVVIPNTIDINGNTYSVTSIAANSFTSSTGAESVSIPRTVTNIELPNFEYSVEEIIVDSFNKNYSSEDGVLYNVNKSELISFPGAKLPGGHFNVPRQVTKIGPRSFLRTKLSTITIPEGVLEIDSIAFAESSIESMILPASIEKIGRGAFVGMRNCTEFTANIRNANFISLDGVLYTTNYGKLVQYPLKRKGAMYRIETGTLEVGPEAFMYNTTLERLYISPSIEVIGANAFYGCSNLTNLDLSGNIAEIGENAFADCTGLATIWMGRCTKSIGVNAFGVTGAEAQSSPRTNLIRISCNSQEPPYMASQDGKTAFDKYDYDIVPLYVPYGCKEAYSKAEGWNRFKTIVEMEEEQPYTYEILGVGECMITSAVVGLAGTVVVPESFTLYGEEYKVVRIGEGAFEDCTSIKHLVIGKDVRSIEADAFRGCSSLLSITIEGDSENGDTLNIGSRAFDSCRFINEIVVWKTVPPVLYSDNVFSTSIYQKATLCVPEVAKDKYATDRVWKYFTKINPMGIEETEVSTESIMVSGNTIFVEGGSAQVYSLSGTLVGVTIDGRLDGLVPGIYIVRINSKVAKVLVR